MKKSFINNSFLLLFIAIFIIFAAIFTGISFYNYNHISSIMQDIEYKKEILKDSGNPRYKLENLRPLVGENELVQFIKQNDKNPQIYTPSESNLKKGIYRANLHTHTTNSDGYATVEERLDEAQEYAKTHIKNGYMYVAITDHNTVLGAKELIDVLQRNPKKYNNIKVIAGMEVYTKYRTKMSDTPVDIHVLLWCINPYDKYLNRAFYKADLKDKWNYKEADFVSTIRTLSHHGLVGIAHPARYTAHLKDKKYDYINELFKIYSASSDRTLFTEGYYQAYKGKHIEQEMGRKFPKYLNFINKQAEKRNIIRTGSTDAHVGSIFR